MEQAQQLAAAERRRAEVEALSASRMRKLALAMVVLATVAIIAGLWARHLGQLARTRELAVSAAQQLELDPELSVLLAREAHRLNPIPFAARTLQSALLASHVRAALRPGDVQGLSSTDDSQPEFRRVAFSPDGSVVAAHEVKIGSTNPARLWLWRPAAGHTNVPCGYGELKSLMFTPDSTHLLTAGGDGIARVWDVARGTVAATLRSQPDAMNGADLSSDGRLVVTAGRDGHALLWDWRADKVLADWAHPRSVVHARFSPDGGSVVTAADDGRIRFWRQGESQPYRTAEGIRSQIRSMMLSPDGRWLASVHANGRAGLIESASGKLSFTNSNPTRFVALRFSPQSDSLVLFGTAGAEIWHLSSSTNAGSSVLAVSRIAPDSQVLQAGFSPDGRWVCTALANNSVRVWSAEDGVEAALFRGHRRQVNDAAFSPDGRFVVSASHDGTVRLWDVEASLGKLTRAPESGDRLETAAIDGHRALIRGTNAEAAASWQIWTDSARSRIALPGLPADLPGAAFSPDGALLATIEGAEVRLRDAAAGQIVGRMPWNIAGGNPEMLARPGELKPLVIEFSGDGKWLMGAGDLGELVRWRMSDRTEVGPRRRGSQADPAHLALSQDGELLVTARLDSTLEVWRGSSNAPVVLTNRTRTGSIAIDPSGELIAAGLGDGSIRLWWSDRRLPPTELRGHTLQVNCLGWSRDGRLLASGSADGTVQLWSVDRSAGSGGLVSAERLGALRGFTGRHDEGSDWTINTVAFGNDGASLVATSNDGEVRRYNLPELAPGADLQQLVTRQRLTRGVTREEALRYQMR
uniref:Putative WD-40 repeat protein n=1 Tax=uncultured prokaryote EC6 TaxID=672204 RepID=D3W8K1_9ZZZZ|nr:putative WD-40 repeat protein [uncultured prokaryote EC6]